MMMKLLTKVIVDMILFLTILNLIIIIQFITPSQALSSSSAPPNQSAAAKLLDICKESRQIRNSVILPGVHDALSAKIFSKQGAKALFISGFGVSATKLGQPDVGLLTQTEMEQTLKSVVQAVASYSTPIIVDGDTGYGGVMNIRRTIRDFASVGAAAVSIEDQIFPKKCTYAAGSGVRVVSFEECRERMKIALAARDEARKIDGNDILVVARTDCRAALGLEEAVKRCQMFEDLGADICYAENLQSKEEYIHLRKELDPSTLTMLAQVQLFPPQQNDIRDDDDDDDHGQLLFTSQEVGEMGYDLTLFGVTPLQAMISAIENTASEMLQTSESSGFVKSTPLSSFRNLKNIVGFDEAEEFEASLQ